nr:hypothetical protein [Tanacetum cinerariifolium]
MDPHISLGRLCMDEHHRITLNDMIKSEGLDAYESVTDLEYEKNLISNEITIKLGLKFNVKKNGEKEGDVEPWVIFEHLFLKLTKVIVDFGNNILTIYPDLITFNSNFDDELDAILSSINVEGLSPLDITDFLRFVCNMGKNIRNVHGESDSDDDEDYCLKRDEMGKPFYGPNHTNYLNYKDPIDRDLDFQDAINQFKKICVW